MIEINFTKSEARSFMVNYHFINTKNKLLGKNSIITIFERLQSIQFDPLNVVGNNSNLVLQSRIKDYKSNMLEEALYKERFLIDGLDKMMGIYLTKDYPLFKRTRIESSKNHKHSLEYRLQMDPLDYTTGILESFRNNGPMLTREFNLGETKKHVWGNVKHSSATLDYLFYKGEIGIHNRKNTQKRYDLIDRLIGDVSSIEPYFENEDEYILYFLLRRIKTMGLVWNRGGVSWSGHLISSKKIRDKYLKILLEKELITKIKIKDIKYNFYAPTEALNYPIELMNNISFIAPLDNMIWDRMLVNELFNFDYKWEVYTPVIKRKYGYYVLPILYKDTFIGRIEFNQQRNSDPLSIKNIWWEDNIKVTKKIEQELSKALIRFSKYLNANL